MTILTKVMGDTKRSCAVGLFVFFFCVWLYVWSTYYPSWIIFIYHLLLFSYFKKIVIYCLVALALHCCMWAFSGYDEHGAVHAKSLSCVQLFATLWTVACQAPLSMGFSRREYWSGLTCPTPGGLSNPASPAIAGGFFITSATGEALCLWVYFYFEDKSICIFFFFLDSTWWHY